jgi:hypothetical protein
MSFKELLGAPLEVSGLLVVGNQGNFQRATIGVVDYARDLAGLNLIAPPEVIESEAATGLLIAQSYPDVGARVGYAGFPLGQQLLASSPHPTYAVGVIGTQVCQQGNRKDV